MQRFIEACAKLHENIVYKTETEFEQFHQALRSIYIHSKVVFGCLLPLVSFFIKIIPHCVSNVEVKALGRPIHDG